MRYCAQPRDDCSCSGILFIRMFTILYFRLRLVHGRARARARTLLLGATASVQTTPGHDMRLFNVRGRSVTGVGKDGDAGWWEKK